MKVTWLASEEAKLRELHSRGAPREEIAAALPRHAWRTIRRRANRLGLFHHRREVHPVIDKLRDKRRAMMLTYTQLGEFTGISRGTLVAMETGQNGKFLYRIEKWCRALGLTLTVTEL